MAASAPAPAPVLSPVVKRYQSTSSGSSATGRLLRGVGWFLLFCVVVSAGIGGAAYLYYNETVNAVKAHSKPVTDAEKLLHTLGSPDEPAIALIAGYDHRAGTGTSSYAGSNSDTLMLLRANPKNNTLSLLSFPRDLNVPIYCKGNTTSFTDRINAAWADCGKDGGPYAAVDTIEHLIGGKPINYLITLDFRAFQDIVHGLHGVYLNVDRRYYHSNAGTLPGSIDRYSEIDLHPGYQKLSGSQALEYVRFRHLDSDIYRNGRQQLFMEALKARLKSTLTLTNFTDALGIIHAVKQNLEIAKADGSAPTLDEIKSYLGLLLSLPAGHLFRNSIPPAQLQEYVTSGGADELRASPQAIAGAVHRFLRPVVPKVHHKHKHRHTSGPGTKTPSMPHKDISVLVLNAGNITGEAADTSSKLYQRGFDTKSLPSTGKLYANAPKKTRDTFVYYDPSQDNGEKAAQVLAALFPRSHVEQMPPGIATPYAQQAGGPLTVVAIGTSFKGKLKGADTQRGGQPKGPSTAHAQVMNGIPLTLSAVRSKDKPAHFTLMLPHKVASGTTSCGYCPSTLSTMEGVRLFKPYKGTQELVLTFNIAGIEYWQIEESNWTDEPLLANPTKTFTFKGRKYAEFTSGGAIQEIAVYAGHSVYWVQNTILNSLSNSTMIAIAEGLKPLH